MSTGPPILEVQGLRIHRGGVDLLHLPALAVAPGETLALIGPNGAGKSTLLLALSGIEPAAAGELRFRGERVPPGAASLAYRRRIAMVFQEPLLFDTTVFENVASGLRLRGVAREEIGRRVGENLEHFRIGHLANRSARTLSGGEAQRTSLARALAVAPEVLLLDEPFAALDPQSREGLIEDLTRTLRETGTTTIFVTHDRIEAQRLADRIAVLEGGRLRQIGTVEEVLRRPADSFVATFVGVENLLPVRLAPARAGGAFTAHLGGGGALPGYPSPACTSLEVGGAAPGMRTGSEGLLCVRPEDILLAVPGDGEDCPRSSCALPTRREPCESPGAGNRLKGDVVSIVPQGPILKVSIDCGARVVASLSAHLARELAVQPGCAVTVVVRPSDLYVIPRG